MKVILSIKPDFVEKIIKGEKEFEFRRKLFSREVESVIIYASSPLKKVVGEFTIEDILNYDLDTLWNITKEKSGISSSFFYEYFKGLKKGYAIKIKKFYLYRKTLNLSELGIITSPQSFVYYYDSVGNTLIKGVKPAKKQNPQADTTQWGREIDELLYKLYGLTEEEIRIVEGK